jgi:hypothetical protein
MMTESDKILPTIMEQYADMIFCLQRWLHLVKGPHHNKSLAFTEKERDAHYLRGLLPPVVVSQEIQVCAILSHDNCHCADP